MSAIRVSAVLLAVLPWLVAGCEAYDLGDERAPAIAVDASRPTWNGGVREILAKRCDNCHGKGERPFAPGDVAAFKWGLAENEAVFREKYAAASLARVRDTQDPMPPAYADPLSDTEKAALVKYVETARAAADPLAACEKRTTTLTFEDDIKTITDQACATCHPGVRPSDLTGVAGFKANRVAVYEYLTGKRPQPMPPYSPGFAATANGRKLVEWICAAEELD